MSKLHPFPYLMLIAAVTTAMALLSYNWKAGAQGVTHDMAAVPCQDAGPVFEEIELGRSQQIPPPDSDGLFTPAHQAIESTQDPEEDVGLTLATAVAHDRDAAANGDAREAVLLEAYKVMLKLYQDGLLMVPTSIACAREDTNPTVGTSRILLERFRHLHQEFERLTGTVQPAVVRDSALIREWSELHWDLAIITRLAVELRKESPGQSGELSLH